MIKDAEIFRLSKEFKTTIRSFLLSMSANLNSGRFRFCQKNSLAPTTGKSGLFVTCFAMKSAWQSGIWDEWSENQKKACVAFVKSFQSADGSFVDKRMLLRTLLLTSLSFLPRGKFSRWKEFIPKVIRAETRQSASTLLMAGETPIFSLPIPFPNTEEIRSYVRSLEWKRPWDAGSHAGHLISLINMNRSKTKLSPTQEALAEAVFEELDLVSDPSTGTWFNGRVDPMLKINGAMKILTAYAWTDKTPRHAKSLMDFALSQPFEEDGCGFLNRLYVVHQVHKYLPDYRKPEVIQLAEEALQEIMNHRHAGSGFSFYKRKAQTRYYGSLVSFGGQQADMHGTMMLTWACAICFELLGVSKSLGWQTHKP